MYIKNLYYLLNLIQLNLTQLNSICAIRPIPRYYNNNLCTLWDIIHIQACLGIYNVLCECSLFYKYLPVLFFIDYNNYISIICL